MTYKSKSPPLPTAERASILYRANLVSHQTFCDLEPFRNFLHFFSEQELDSAAFHDDVFFCFFT